MGKRNQQTTDTFIEGVRHATIPGQRFQVTTDGFQPYVSAITTTLSDRCDYAMHIKVYGQPEDGERRYSPAEVAWRTRVRFVLLRLLGVELMPVKLTKPRGALCRPSGRINTGVTRTSHLG